MNAARRAPRIATQTLVRVIVLLLVAAVVATGTAVLVRSLTTPSRAAVHSAVSAYASDPVGDRWWQDAGRSSPTWCCQAQPH